MTIYVGGMSQESNTFSPSPTDMDVFARGYLLQGPGIIRELRDTNTEMGGFYAALEGVPDVDIVPGIAAWAITSGKVRDDTFEELTRRLVQGVKAMPRVDGVLLFLHGSMVSDSRDDCEGYVLQRVREVVGASVPVVSTLDFHACLTPAMIDNADLLVGYRTYPHVDLARTGQRAAKCLLDLVRSPRRVSKEWRKIPLIPAVENCMTDVGPMVHAMAQLEELDRDPDVVSTSIFMPQPWLDTPETAAGMIIYTARPERVAAYRARVREVLEYVWGIRKELSISIPGIDHFIASAAGLERPICVVDLGDIVSAGGMGDSTEVLRAFIDKGFPMRSVMSIVDPGSVKKAASLGEGADGWFDLGGATDHGYNRKVRVHAKVVRVSDEVVTAKAASLRGVKLNAGTRALLQCGETLSIIVSEFSAFNHDPEFVRSMGLEPGRLDVIVQKTHQMFKAGYAAIMKSCIYADTPGFTDRNLERLPFRKVKRPIYPLDKDAAFE